MKKLLFSILFALAFLALPRVAAACPNHYAVPVWQQAYPQAAWPAPSATPPVALSAPNIAAPEEERDTRHDWQERIRANRDRYAD